MKDQGARSAMRTPLTFVTWTAADCERAIPDHFADQVTKTPDAIAVALPAGDITYTQLDIASDSAARLVCKAVGADSRPVALLCQQGYESIVWTLGVLKAGLAYAPLDQRLPVSTLRRMLEHLDPSALLTTEPHLELADGLGTGRIPTLAANDAFADQATGGTKSPHHEPHADGLAYIFYTSGSTGAPKGVVDTHRGVLHNILRYTNSLRFGPGDRLSMVQNPSFSGTVSTMFGALLNGATLVPFDLQGNGLSSLSAWTRSMRISVFHAVPSIFRVLSDPIEKFPDLRLVRLEGDRASGLDLSHFRINCQPSCTLVNGLGATECGLVRQYFVDVRTPSEAGELVPIGYPVPDVVVQVLNDRGQDSSPDSAGEIVVESRFLARGYWRNPALTSQRFEDLGEGRRRYRTGDLGRLGPDGCLVHLGRMDQRIRIAGEFVDGSEIERLLASLAGVRQAVVHDYLDDASERRLCAYVVRERGANVSLDGLRRFLTGRVGSEAIPTALVLLEQFPLTKDLKVDRQRLPKPGRERPSMPNEYEAPQTSQERLIAQVWSEVLEIDRVGVTDSLLALGGDSLRAARIVNRLRPIFGDRIRVTSVFEHPTIRALARALELPDSSRDAKAVAKLRQTDDHRIAIIGAAARLPGADSIDEFWQNLRAGREGITFFRPEPDALLNRPEDVVFARGLLSDVDRFDASLFKMTPRQAQLLDPQQRIWLECVHHALEDAGIPIAGSENHVSRIGVYAGGKESTYLWHVLGGQQSSVDALLSGASDDALELLNSNDRDSIATRTSFVFGLTGPSVNVQSACSTSLVAVAQACQALATGQCDVAIAGGVTVTFPQRRAYRHESGGMYSRDGHCRAFDAEASGTTFSDGAGVVILKRFDQAARDGDRIDAIVRGWAVNNDGSTKASFAAPSVEGQVRVITAAQEHAGVRPRDVSYVEAHGTGTPIGDPIEFTALERAFRREGGDDRGFCGLGSVKSNIGHVDAAAGVAGLIKTVLALKYRELPATLHFRSPNPEIALATSPFYIVSQLTPWHARGPRIAGVSSLGVGGTNCHVVLEEPPDRPPAAAEPTTSLVTLSAASPDALDALEARYRDFVASDSSAELVAVASTSQRHRAHRRYRTAIRCGDRAGFLEGATTRLGSDRRDESLGWRSWRGTASDDLSVGFLFAGQGSQYAGMGRALYEENLDFRRLLDRCNDLLRSRLDRPLLDVMFGAPDESLIDRTEYAQPAIFALEYSIAALLRQWGIQPRMVLGHSVGEYVAACVADVFSLEDGLRLSADRGRLMQRVPGTGRMLAVASSPDAVRDLVRPVAADVSVAAFNSPFQTVISGHGDAVARLEHQLREQGVHTRTLAVSHAFHSPQMDSALQPLEHAFEGLSLRPAAIPVVSNVTGRVAGNELTQSAYWSTHARAAVQFADSIRTVIDAGCDVLVEIGPDSIFSTLVRENDLNSRLTTIATLHRAEHGWAALLDTLGQLYVRGAEVDWKATHGGVSAPPVRLPGYPFQRHRHWYEGALANKGGSHPIARADGHPLLGSRLRLPGSDEIRFEVQFSQTAPHYLADHRLFGVSLPPGASHFAMLAQAADVLRGGDTARNGFRFESLYLLRPLLLPDGCGRTVQLILRPRSEGWEIELTSALLGAEESSDGWTTHMVGRGRAVDAAHEPLVTWDLEAIRAASTQSISGREFYSKIWANHGGTGSSFRWIDSVWQGNRVALCRAKRPRTVTNVSRYRLHPGLVEAACQVLHCCGEIETAAGPESSGATYVPFSVDALSLTGAAATHDEAWCHARLRELTTENVIADLTILSSSGEVVAQLDGFCLRQISRAAVIDRPQESSTAYPGSHFGSAEPSRPLPISAHDVALYLRRRCAELTGHVESELRLDVGFAALGLDSIAAMRLSNQMLRDLGRTVHLGQILTCSNLLALAEAIATEDGDGSGAAIPTRTVPSQRTEGGSTVDARGSGDPE